MIEICVQKRFSITERHTCQRCNRDDDKFYFHCKLGDGSMMIICGGCLYIMSQDEDNLFIHSPPEAEGIGEIGILVGFATSP